MRVYQQMGVQLLCFSIFHGSQLLAAFFVIQDQGAHQAELAIHRDAALHPYLI